MAEWEASRLNAAYAVFRRLNNMPHNQNSRRVFNKFLGRSEDAFIYWPADSMDDAAAAKLRWLLGPHAATMYKVWKIQHGEK